MNIFEKATKTRLRFSTNRGLLTVEDIWHLPLTRTTTNLDDLAINLRKQINTSKEESFVKRALSADTELQLKFDIVIHIITVRLNEEETAQNAAAIKAKDQKILAIIANKEDVELNNKDIEELKAMLST